MTTQTEQILENNLVEQLQGLGYSTVTIKDSSDLLLNLKQQLEKFNKVKLSDKEFQRVLIHLDNGTIFDRAHILRDRMHLEREDGSVVYLQFVDTENSARNIFQVTRQVTIEGVYKNRYDVTLLVNGLPLVQIELKRRGLELKEAFNQTRRYQKHSYWASHGLFNYIQCFVISNGVNTKYYANNREQSWKQTFYWAEKDNRPITNLDEFASSFLRPGHLSKMLFQYIVLNQTEKILMILRPYQYYATEAIVDRVRNSKKNGYIWHTTGSGKTLTSFKAAQILAHMEDVYKVVFVVDRKDLDYQTIREFNAFSKGSVDGTDRTKVLVDQFLDRYKDPGTGELKKQKLIVTTLQKLNTAISKPKFLQSMERLQDERIIFIFDECHRSQFGDTHQRITSFFRNHQLFGFTGTPIFEVNAHSKYGIQYTTKSLFHECLHQYVITDAIRDQNVLKFSVEYVGRYHQRDSATEVDIDVEAIDKKELLDSPKRLEKIVDWILANHGRKTHGRDFNAILCVSSVEVLLQYMDLLLEKKRAGLHDLNLATIFSYSANEDELETTGIVEEDLSLAAEPASLYGLHSRDKLEAYIQAYNGQFGTNYTNKDSDSFYNYYKDVSKRVKSREVDLLVVVNMFLTGFDSKTLNTLYVDKNLRYHGLIQAFSRTNRILNEVKSQGNIVCFRNLKERTDEAIALFSDKDAEEDIFIPPYEEFKDRFEQAYRELLQIAPTVDSVNDLQGEDQQLAFVMAFRELMRLRNILESFANFRPDELPMSEQLFADYKSKYLDLYRSVKESHQKEKVSILDDVDFELELIQRDEINVQYILNLLARMKDAKGDTGDKIRNQVTQILGGEVQLYSKRELIQQFIDENLPHIDNSEDIAAAFEDFWNVQKRRAFDRIIQDEKLDPEVTERIIGNYLYTERQPLADDIFKAMKEQPGILEKRNAAARIWQKLLDFVGTFIEGMVA